MVAVCRVLPWINTTSWVSKPHCLFWITRCNYFGFSQQTSLFRHIILQVENISLHFVFLGDRGYHHFTNYHFISGITCDAHVSSLMIYGWRSWCLFSVQSQKFKCAIQPFHFVIFHKHLRQPACTQFLTIQFLRHFM